MVFDWHCVFFLTMTFSQGHLDLAVATGGMEGRRGGEGGGGTAFLKI